MATFAQLRELDTETFRRAASGYSRLADTTALNADTVEAASRDLASWTGDAGAAATRKLDDFSSTFDQTHERLSELDKALADHASKMEQHQRRLANVVIDITSNRRGQLTIDLRTGQIGVVVDHEDGGIDRRLVAEHREHLAQQYADEIRRILGDATEADADTARRLAGILAAVTGGRPPNAAVLLASVPRVGSDPKAVKAWWSSLSPAEREFLIRERPDVIGWLDGVPAADRDEANRLVLTATAAGLEDRLRQLESKGQLTPQEQAELTALRERLKGVNAIRNRIAATGLGQERVYLMGFDTAGHGHVVLAIGDPDAADNVVTYVPGTGSSLDHAGGDITRADRMTQEANTFDPSRRTSTILWIGYDAPQNIVPEATQPGWAQNGADDLDRFQDGLRVTHEGARSHNTVVGHSYGSTVVGYTASGYGLDADDVIFVGSPGVGTDTVGGLHGADGQPLPPDHVWSSHARHDPIQYASPAHPWPWDRHGNLVPDDQLVHGQNPTEPEFGARTFTSDPGEPLATMKAHSQYWDPYSTSLRNMTYIVTGRYGDVH